jgi:Protein of unknown function (DUF4242)/Protein of unknown function (DUF3465)
MDVHQGMVDITPQALNEAHQADLAIQGNEGVDFKHGWAGPGVSMVLCLSDAPSAEAVKRIHERAGHPTTRPPMCPYRRDPPGDRHDREVVIGSRACPRRTRPQRSTGWGHLSWRPAACKLVLVGSILAAALTGCHPVRPDNQGLIVALHHGRSAEVTVQGLVVVLLPDGNGPDGPHQRFRVDVGQGVVVEVDHNLTLAPRVPVTVGSTVIVHGQFEPDPGRPVIHYTHHPTGAHEGGWIESSGHRYQ